jgi:hypothetical protein
VVAVVIPGSVIAGSEADVALDPLKAVAGEREVRLDSIVRIFARMTSVFPAAATSRSRYLPPPTAPSDMPLS